MAPCINKRRLLIFCPPSWLGKMVEPAEWTDGLSQCQLSGIGRRVNTRYSSHMGQSTADHELMHEAHNIDENGLRVYLLLCGYNGDNEAPKFIYNQLADQVFNELDVSPDMEPQEILDLLVEKFQTVVRVYNNQMSELLSTRLLLEEQLLPQNDADAAGRISEIDAKLRTGTTVLLALIEDNHIYVLNCGNSRCLLVCEENETYKCHRLLNVHSNEDENERRRLEESGIDPNIVIRPTRAIGDCFRNEFGYRKNTALEKATSPPITSDPDAECFEIKDQYKYLMLVSDAVATVLEEMGTPPEGVDSRLMDIMMSEQTQSSTLSIQLLASAVLDRIARDHEKQFMTGERAGKYRSRDDMSLIIVALSEDEPSAPPVNYSVTSQDSVLPEVRSNTPIAGYVDLDNFDRNPQSERIIRHLCQILGFNLLSDFSQNNFSGS